MSFCSTYTNVEFRYFSFYKYLFVSKTTKRCFKYTNFFLFSEIRQPTQVRQFISNLHHLGFVINILNHPFPRIVPHNISLFHSVDFFILINNLNNRAFSVCGARAVEHYANVYAVVTNFQCPVPEFRHTTSFRGVRRHRDYRAVAEDGYRRPDVAVEGGFHPDYLGDLAERVGRDVVPVRAS